MTKCVAIFFACLWAAFPSWGQSEIQLRHCAIVELNGPVTLGMIADLEGEYAASFRDVVIVSDPGVALSGERYEMERTVEEVRAILSNVEGLDWSRLLLSGGTCTIRRAGAPPDSMQTGPAPASLPVVASLVPMTTVRGHAAIAIARALRADAQDVRLRFDPRDARVLSTRASGAVEAVVTALSDDVPVRITMYQGERIVLSENVRIEARVRRKACLLTRDVREGEVITPGHYRVEQRWLEPTAPAISPASAPGLTATAHLSAGEVLLDSMAELPIVVERGELVTLHCINGAVVVRMPARALEDGVNGQIVTFERLDGQGELPARISGTGRAVVVSGADIPGESTRTKEPTP